ncbi:HPr-rel-A system PqqD family peptide chaperone [Sphingobium aquiterrae]|uniref:HPr-rel-A system PqqD family peptide chaperone n=1 Tax=Sphingobium aquiterrae TaxID=2038656 RepID=UPI003018481D
MIRHAACPASALIVRPLDAVTLIYHRPSGQTHMVVSPVPEMLDALMAGPASTEELVARLALSFDLGARDEALPVIAAHLEELVALGLVARG